MTGIGLVSPLGWGLEKNWAALLAGTSGITRIRRFATDHLKTTMAGTVDLPEEQAGADPVPAPVRVERMAEAAIAEALAQAGLSVGDFPGPLMLGMPAIGIATVATNLWFLYHPSPGPLDWLKEHLKALVGAGISVYTAFMTFGLVRFLPRTGPAESHAALNPALWAVPLTIGLAIIIYHRIRIGRWGQRDASPRVQVAE